MLFLDRNQAILGQKFWWVSDEKALFKIHHPYCFQFNLDLAQMDHLYWKYDDLLFLREA